MGKLPARQEWQPGFAHHTIMEGAEDELAILRAENNMLKGMIASHGDMRALIGELRRVNDLLARGLVDAPKHLVENLLRRLDRES